LGGFFDTKSNIFGTIKQFGEAFLEFHSFAKIKIKTI
jgi:hypothetical protein